MLPYVISNSAWGEPQTLLEAPYTTRSLKATGLGEDGRGEDAVAIITTSQMPSSMAAAARHTMPTDEAPPRSTASARLTDHPQYSAMVAGPNRVVSATSPAQTRTVTSE